MRNRIMFNFIVLFVFVLMAQFASAQTVYVTEKGKKYHKKNCSIVNEGKKGIDLAEAKKQGYTPCASCYSEDTKTKKVDAVDPKKK